MCYSKGLESYPGLNNIYIYIYKGLVPHSGLNNIYIYICCRFKLEIHSYMCFRKGLYVLFKRFSVTSWTE